MGVGVGGAVVGAGLYHIFRNSGATDEKSGESGRVARPYTPMGTPLDARVAGAVPTPALPTPSPLPVVPSEPVNIEVVIRATDTEAEILRKVLAALPPNPRVFTEEDRKLLARQIAALIWRSLCDGRLYGEIVLTNCKVKYRCE